MQDVAFRGALKNADRRARERRLGEPEGSPGTMPTRSRGRSVLLVVAMIGVLGVLVGIVRSTGRSPAAAREGRVPGAGSVTGARDAERTQPVELIAPEILPPVADVPGATPSTTVATERETAPAPGRLAGVVLRRDGEPASGARVLLGRQHARCGEDGAFELLLLDPPGADGGLDLVAHAPGSEPALLPRFGAGLDPRGANEARIVLGPPTLALTGRVETASGAPAKDWLVELDGLDPLADFGLRETVRTDVDGRFTVVDVPEGVHVLLVHRGDRTLGYRSAPASAGETGILVVVGAH